MRIEFPEAAFLFLLFLPIIAALWVNHAAAEKSLALLSGGARYNALRRVFVMKNFFSGFFFLLGLTGIILQLMGLSWNKVPDREAPEGLDVAFVLDVSRSMLASDHAPTRMEGVQAAARSIMENLKDSWFSVSVFKGAGVNLVPLTRDSLAVANTLSRLGPYLVDEAGSNLESGIRVGLRSLDPVSTRRKLLVLFSDMESRAGQPAAALRDAARDGIAVILVGVGSEDGARVPHPEGGYIRDDNGTTVISRFNNPLFRVLGDMDGVEAFHLDAGLINLAGRMSEFQGGGIAMVLRPESTGSFFLIWAAVFFGAAWLVRAMKWKDFF